MNKYDAIKQLEKNVRDSANYADIIAKNCGDMSSHARAARSDATQAKLDYDIAMGRMKEKKKIINLDKPNKNTLIKKMKFKVVFKSYAWEHDIEYKNFVDQEEYNCEQEDPADYAIDKAVRRHWGSRCRWVRNHEIKYIGQVVRNDGNCMTGSIRCDVEQC